MSDPASPGPAQQLHRRARTVPWSPAGRQLRRLAGPRRVRLAGKAGEGSSQAGAVCHDQCDSKDQPLTRAPLRRSSSSGRPPWNGGRSSLPANRSEHEASPSGTQQVTFAPAQRACADTSGSMRGAPRTEAWRPAAARQRQRLPDPQALPGGARTGPALTHRTGSANIVLLQHNC
jgi:hypothetical protein